ncbi:membrane protein [Enterococcus florum]|uniref:Membrane protein n=1 Tax=Enterococcus florum TaxID=2480627 RepID=A0A4P5P8Y3_9ENTE|nr:DUF998 domain-containing protein [Enterococcus florum]GCF92681.1 membrane protein [Enterococcus florum]
MNTLKKYGFHFLLIGVISDFLTPYVLGLFYPALNQRTMVISLVGEVGSPVRGAFLVWSVVAGLFYVLSLPAVYGLFKETSRSLAFLLTAAIGIYGIGDCIFTGLFSVDTEQAGWSLSTWIHNVGSGIGYAGFLIFPLFLVLLYHKQGKIGESRGYLVLLVLSLIFAGIYGVARTPITADFPLFNQLGLWQRVSFFFNYIPLTLFALRQLFVFKNQSFL